MNNNFKYDGIEVDVIATKYEFYDNLCVVLAKKGTQEIYTVATKNIDSLPYDEAAVDTNNLPDITEFIEKYELGVNTGKTFKSGFCTYPIYRFYLNKMAQI